MQSQVSVNYLIFILFTLILSFVFRKEKSIQAVTLTTAGVFGILLLRSLHLETTLYTLL